MHHSHRRFRFDARRAVVLALVAIALARAAPAGAQVPGVEWRTIRTEHFRVTFAPGLEDLARHAGARAEVAYARLREELTRAPRGVIDIVVTDHTDSANGFATPFPSNRITLYAAPPAGDPALSNYRDWLDLLIVHELTHIFHLDRTGLAGVPFRWILGRIPERWPAAPELLSPEPAFDFEAADRVTGALERLYDLFPYPWPAFPVVGTPGWSIEGLATLLESEATGAGRVHGSIHEMMLRTAVLEGAFDPVDVATGPSPHWPGALRRYVYGSLFMDWLADEHGPEVHRELVDATAGALIPPAVAFDRVARKALGTSFSGAWGAWESALGAGYARLADSLRAAGLTESAVLTDGPYYALYPRAAADGRIVYAAFDGRGDVVTRIWDPSTRESRTLSRRNGLGPTSWLPAGRGLVTAQFEARNYTVYQDLVVIDGRGRERRVTDGARLTHPDVAPDGRSVVAVQNDGGTNRLVVFDLETRGLRPLTDYDGAVHWAFPRWSPDGERIAAARWSEGAHGIVLVAADGSALPITSDPAMDGAPAWSPDGRYVLFWSDRTGIPNLFAHDTHAAAVNGSGQLETALHQVTNVLTGAFYPEVSPDGEWIYYSGYHRDGYRLERIPFDRAAWRPVAPPAEGEPPAVAAAREPGGPEAAGFGTAPAAGAAAPPPAATAPATPYSPVRSLLPRYWIPVGLDRGAAGVFRGARTSGRDLVGRHSYAATAAVDPVSRRAQGNLHYRWAGLGSPVIGASVSRDWGHLGAVTLGDGAQADVISMDDFVAVSATVLRRRSRSSASATVGGQRIARQRSVLDAPDVRLVHPSDRLVGVFAGIRFDNARRYPFSISPENGISLELGGGRNWDRDRSDVFDGTYSEVAGRLSAFRGLPVFGFANHVVVGRVGGLWRDGPGAVSASILPVREFRAGRLTGTRAWSAAVEYRVPLALVARGHRLWPVFADRVWGAFFLEGGDASCGARHAGQPGCLVDPVGPRGPLLAAGAEVTLGLVLYHRVAFPLKFGVGVPLRGTGERAFTYARAGT